jgi:hypothetical protein
MKKILLAGMLAICLIAASQQQASAWHNVQFGIGLNWCHQSGGNNFMWGMIKGGQPPGPEYFEQSFPHYGSIAPQAFDAYAQMPADMPTYVQPSVNYAPYQFATYPRQEYYYYSTPYYYGR